VDAPLWVGTQRLAGASRGFRLLFLLTMGAGGLPGGPGSMWQLLGRPRKERLWATDDLALAKAGLGRKALKIATESRGRLHSMLAAAPCQHATRDDLPPRRGPRNANTPRKSKAAEILGATDAAVPALNLMRRRLLDLASCRASHPVAYQGAKGEFIAHSDHEPTTVFSLLGS